MGRNVFDKNLGGRERQAAVRLLWNLGLWSCQGSPLDSNGYPVGRAVDSVRFVQHDPITDVLFLEYHAPVGGVTKVRKTVQACNRLEII
jgi:hypothetical protein